jgi:hypothetical protein
MAAKKLFYCVIKRSVKDSNKIPLFSIKDITSTKAIGFAHHSQKKNHINEQINNKKNPF